MVGFHFRRIGCADHRKGNQPPEQPGTDLEQPYKQQRRQRIKEQQQERRKRRLIDAAAKHIHKPKPPAALLCFPTGKEFPKIRNVQAADMQGIKVLQMIGIDYIMRLRLPAA